MKKPFSMVPSPDGAVTGLRAPSAQKPFADTLPKPARRTFLKWLGVAVASPALAPAFKSAISEAALGRGFAQPPPEATYFVEIALRDQVDFGHVMVAPGLARHTDLRRGPRGRQCALYYRMDELIEARPNLFLTPQSQGLAPHLDHVAMVELCDLTNGPVHGHEAANPIRSPGRTRSTGGGRTPMWQGEPGSGNGEGAFYSSTPTPTALHNYWQRQLEPDLHNGVVIKGTERSGAMYHFAAGLPGAEPDRYQNAEELLRAFPPTTQGLDVLPDPGEAALVQRFLRRVDPRLLRSRGYSETAIVAHEAQVEDAQRLLHRGEVRVIDLALTAEERAQWAEGVPGRYGRTRIDPSEQAAYAFKLISGGLVRSVALEIDIGDVHGERTETQMRDQTLTTVGPLVHLIESFKAAGLWNRTLIAAYTLDGGRAPASGSSGDEGKNGVILAGGMIRGGYFGDIRVAGDESDGHRYAYHRPSDDTGAPIAEGTTGNDRRVEAASLYRTVARAMGVPDTVVAGFPDVTGRTLPWLLR